MFVQQRIIRGCTKMLIFACYMTNIRNFVFNAFGQNTMILTKDGTSECLIVDPGFHTTEEKRTFLDALEGLNPLAVLLTHAHFDHIFGLECIQSKYGIPAYMHPLEEATLQYDRSRCKAGSFTELHFGFSTTPLQEGPLCIGPFECEVIWTPGHTPGSVCYHFKDDGFVLTGDTLFAGTIGRTDFGPGNYDDEIRSIMNKLMALPPDTIIVPGHAGRSSIGYEGTNNPFLEPFNEPEETVL